MAILTFCLLSLASAAPGPPATPTVKEEDRFVDNGDGTVTDSKTNLMWAAKDSGEEFRSDTAEHYCAANRGGGHRDWRMPTMEELKGLYNLDYSQAPECWDKSPVHLTRLIHLSCPHVWSATESGSHIARFFYFSYGYASSPRGPNSLAVALPVRTLKK